VNPRSHARSRSLPTFAYTPTAVVAPNASSLAIVAPFASVVTLVVGVAFDASTFPRPSSVEPSPAYASLIGGNVFDRALAPAIAPKNDESFSFVVLRFGLAAHAYARERPLRIAVIGRRSRGARATRARRKVTRSIDPSIQPFPVALGRV
tara:strand:+ start:1084 stop:1533 length:450 start_codon:yes stop_codon:yes gene_type:complete